MPISVFKLKIFKNNKTNIIDEQTKLTVYFNYLFTYML